MSGRNDAVWPVLPLGTLLTDIQPGFASGKHNSAGEGVPHFRPMNVSTDGLVDRNVLKFVDPTAGRPAIRLRRGDVVFNNTNSPELVGKTALFDDDDEPAFSNHMTRLRVDPTRLDPGYLALRLHQAWREGWFAAHCNNHVSQASIGREVIRAFNIELPPMEVQGTITALARAVDGRRASCNSHLSIARQAIERFRQAVLVAVWTGVLNGGHEDAHLVRIHDIVTDLHQGWSPQCLNRPASTPDEWGVIKTTAVQPLGFISIENKALPTELEPRPSLTVLAGDLLVTRAGPRSRVGITCLVNKTYDRLMICDKVYRLRVDRRRALSGYLVLVLNSTDALRQIEDLKTGTSESGLNLTQRGFMDLQVPVPELSAQAAIVHRVNQLFQVADRLQQRLETASRRVDRTAQAALAKAFRGDLVSNGEAIP